MKRKPRRTFILTAQILGRLKKNPECRACGRILNLGERVHVTKIGGGLEHNPKTRYFCRECWNKPILIYPPTH